jgi:competence protein ComEA
MFEEKTSLIKAIAQVWRAASPVVVLELSVGLCGLVAVGFGFFHYLVSANQSVACTLPQELSDQFSQSVVVSIGGAVEEPGLIPVKPGTRLGQAIDQAGGFKPEADKAFINKQLNLASLVTDQQQVYIPFISESVIAAAKPIDQVADDEATSTSIPAASAPTSTGISINTASAAELETLPGIGAKRADDIIQNRPYQSLTELTDKKIISTSLFTDIEAVISL